MLRSQPATRCSLSSPSVQHGHHPSGPRLSARRELPSPCLVGVPVLWICHARLQRCSAQSPRQKLCSRAAVEAKGFQKLSPGSAKDVDIDACNLRHPLEHVSPDLEDDRWTDTSIRQLVTNLYFFRDNLENTEMMSQLLREVTRMYSSISWETQLWMLVVQWWELCKEQGTPTVGDPSAEVHPDLRQKAPEPLCWRRVENTAGLTVAAADVLFWKGTMNNKDARARSSRGFASQSGSFDKPLEELRPCSRRPEDIGLLFATLKFVLAMIRKLSPDSQPIRLLLPQVTSKTLETFALEGLEVQTYSRTPTWEQLASDRHLMVLMYRDATVPADSDCWTLPLEVPGGTRAVNAAPVLMLSILEHGVKMNFPGIYSKMSRWLKKAAETATEDVQDESLDFFTQLSQAFEFGLKKDAPKGSRFRILALLELRSKLPAIIRKAYGATWAKLMIPRLRQLQAAEQDARLLLRRQRERDAAAAIMEADLSQAIQRLDVGMFEKKSRVAKSTQTLAENKLIRLRDQMSLAIVQAQAPLKRLTDECCGNADGALNPEVLHALKAELATTRLSTSDPWLQAGLELKLALEALQQLQIDLNAFLSTSGSTASSPSKPSGEGAEQNNHGAVTKLTQDLETANECMLRFEQRLRAVGREVPPDGVRPLRRYLSACNAKLVDIRRDNDLCQALRAPPWDRKTRILAGVTADARRKLEAIADQATDAGRERLQAQLQEAYSMAELAEQLRHAVKGDDETVLKELLKTATELNISGLGSVQRRLEQLRTTRSDLRRDLAVAVEGLDLASFEKLEARSRASLPPGEVGQLRQNLLAAVAKEEQALEALISCSTTSDDLEAAVTKCRLSSKNAWRTLAQTSLAALQAVQKIRTALTSVPVDEMALQACLTSSSFAAKQLQESLAEVQKLLAPGKEPTATAFSLLQTALDEGYLGLAGAQADQALDTLLSSKMWKIPQWQAIQPSDLRELEVRAEEATKAGRDRFAQPLQTALEVGQCSVELAASMRGSNTEKLEGCLQKAEALGFQGLEKVHRRLENLRVLAEGRRPLRRAVQVPAIDAKAETQLPSCLQREQSPPQDKDSRTESSWPGPVSVESVERDGEYVQVRCTNLIFIDIETTSGFYDFDQMPQILEVAIIITDRDLQELDRGHWVLGGFSQEELEGLGEFHKANFRDAEPGGSFPPLIGYSGGNGLFSDILRSRLSTEEVEDQVMQIVAQHCPPGECPLVGYSVQCDREVIKDKMPRLYRHLSHQIIDVSGFFIVARLWLPEHWQYWDRKSSTYNHRAVNDVEDAIQALRWMREKFFSEGLLPLESSQLASSGGLSALSLPGVLRK